MQIAKKYNRISLLGFIKFFAAILIVWFHTSIFFLPEETWRFTTGRILVELFFIITGYFTAKHFQKDEELIEEIVQMLRENPDKIKDIYKITRSLVL